MAFLLDFFGWRDNKPLELTAAPGLMTVLDLALYRSVEGELTSTICASHALLQAWLDLKHQSQDVLASNLCHRNRRMESFVRHCLDAANDALEKLSTDPLADGANDTDDVSLTQQHHHHHHPQSSQEDKNKRADTGRRWYPVPERPKDCWETRRLICPDHVWAKECLVGCQRLLQNLTKQQKTVTPTTTVTHGPVAIASNELLKVLFMLLQDDLPTRVHQFRAAVDTNAVVLKRMYLVKCEYRAPFRAFLEAHQKIQRAPALDFVNGHCRQKEGEKSGYGRARGSGGGGGSGRRHTSHKHQHSKDDSTVRKNEKQSNITDNTDDDGRMNKNEDNDNHNDEKQSKKGDQKGPDLQELLETPELLDALWMEQQIQTIETSLERALFGFTELARHLDQKRAGLKAVPGLLNKEDVPGLQKLLRRLRLCLCQKVEPESSTGIWPILLDLQGLSRDDEQPNLPVIVTEETCTIRIRELSRQLKTLSKICKTGGAIVVEKPASQRGGASTLAELDVPSSISKDCIEPGLDEELFFAECHDWMYLVREQQKLAAPLSRLAEQIRRAELRRTVQATSLESLQRVQHQLEVLNDDRKKKFSVLQEMLEQVGLRELNIVVQLDEPDTDVPLELPSTSVLGLMGDLLIQHGEILPVG